MTIVRRVGVHMALGMGGHGGRHLGLHQTPTLASMEQLEPLRRHPHPANPVRTDHFMSQQSRQRIEQEYEAEKNRILTSAEEIEMDVLNALYYENDFKMGPWVTMLASNEEDRWVYGKLQDDRCVKARMVPES